MISQGIMAVSIVMKIAYDDTHKLEISGQNKRHFSPTEIPSPESKLTFLTLKNHIFNLGEIAF